MTGINGTLKNASRLSASQDPRGPCLRGQVYGDTKGRFADGEWIVTSRIKSEERDVFKTTFSTYRVDSWAETGGGGDPIVWVNPATPDSAIASALVAVAASLDNIAKALRVPAEMMAQPTYPLRGSAGDVYREGAGGAGGAA